MLRDLLLVLNMIICVALIGVVLMQRSEGGAFGSGGNPTGLVTARGAGDLLTRTTWVLFVLFLSICLALTLMGGQDRSSQAFLAGLKHATINPQALSKPAPAASNTAAPMSLPPVGGPSRTAPAPLGAITLPPVGAPAGAPAGPSAP
jgi:preprotein translocase subunit SecG